MRYLLVALLLLPALASAQAVPSTRLAQANWEVAGVTPNGGIPARTTICATLLAATYGNGTDDATAAMTFNYDWLYNNGVSMVHAYNGVGSLTLAQFRTNSGWENNASVGDPSFENVGTDDYRLAAGSSALTASSTGGPVGCYITGSEEIGLRAAPSY